jgi:uncharacterized protein YxjI
MSLQKTREFILQERLMSFRDKVKVMDKDKNELGSFIGKIIKIGNTFRLRDNSEKEILTIHEKIISLRSSYKFYSGGETNEDKLIGSLKRKLVSIKPSYWFEDPKENQLFTMKGNIWQLKYTINKDNKQIAEVSKKLFKIKDTYGVKIDSGVDDDTAMLILGIVIMLHHEKEEDEHKR